jgi:hypothetical protein
MKSFALIIAIFYCAAKAQQAQTLNEAVCAFLLALAIAGGVLLLTKKTV